MRSQELQRQYTAKRLRGANSGARNAIDYNNQKLSKLTANPVDICKAERIEADTERLKNDIATRERLLRNQFSGC